MLKNTLNSIDEIKKVLNERKKQQAQFSNESPFFKLVHDGDSAKVRFLQEFEVDSENYNEENGTLIVVPEHSKPGNFRLRAVCSMKEEGRCWPCEQAATIQDQKVAKAWRSKPRFYANVIVRASKEGEEDKVKILAQGFSDNNIGDWLMNLAIETGTITSGDMKISRKGEKFNDTSYTPIPLPPKALTKHDKSLKLIPLDKFINWISYEDQADHFNEVTTEAKGDSSSW